jgi:hypothetical protein
VVQGVVVELIVELAHLELLDKVLLAVLATMRQVAHILAVAVVVLAVLVLLESTVQVLVVLVGLVKFPLLRAQEFFMVAAVEEAEAQHHRPAVLVV